MPRKKGCKNDTRSVDRDRSAAYVDKSILANVGTADGRRLADALKRNAEDRDLLAIEADVANQVVETKKASERLLLAFVCDHLATALSLTNRALTVVVVFARRAVTRAWALTTTVEGRGTLRHRLVFLGCVALNKALEQIFVADRNRDSARGRAKESSGVEASIALVEMLGSARHSIDMVCLVARVGLVQSLLQSVNGVLQSLVLLYIHRSAGVRAVDNIGQGGK